MLRTEGLKREITKPLGRTNRLFEDAARFFFHRNAMLGGADPQPRKRLFIKFSNTQAGHGKLHWLEQCIMLSMLAHAAIASK